METERSSEVPDGGGVLDCATLYLCRHIRTWVVVLESPRVTGAVLLRRSCRHADDARFELLSRVRSACPDAAIVISDGAPEDALYDWRLELRGTQQRSGDLGAALQREMSAKRPRHQRRLATEQASLGCRDHSSGSSPNRPPSF